MVARPDLAQMLKDAGPCAASLAKQFSALAFWTGASSPRK